MVVFLIVDNVENLFSDNQLTDLFEAGVGGGLGFKWKPGDFFVGLLRHLVWFPNPSDFFKSGGDPV